MSAQEALHDDVGDPGVAPSQQPTQTGGDHDVQHSQDGDRPRAAEVIANVLSDQQLTPKQRLLRDELGFVAGIANIALSAFWLGRDPSTFYRWWTAKAIVLFGIRYLIYQAQKEHYFLLEMCYIVNVVLAAYVWLMPGSVWLYKAAFGLVAGPLTWSIVALRNSLVMHSLDQMTSLFMHASPAMVIWALRWHPSNNIQDLVAMDPAAAKAFSTGGVRDIVGNAMVLYLIWAVAYYLKIFVVSKEKIQQEGYATLYSYMTRNKNGAVAKLVFSVPKPYQPLVYMGFHAGMATAAMCTAVIWFHLYWAHTAFLAVVLLWAAYNGATYYFHIFANRYVKSVGLEPQDSKKKE